MSTALPPGVQVHEGAHWGKSEDGEIHRWNPDTGEWSVFNGEEGPRPPIPWLKEWQAQQTPESKEARLVKSFAALAREAREAGLSLFQVVLPVSATRTAWFGRQPMSFASTGTRTTTTQPGGLLDAIEREGWRLEQAGYVFQPTGSQSRDRFLATGQIETIVGDLVGIYVFRAERTPEAPDQHAYDGDREDA